MKIEIETEEWGLGLIAVFAIVLCLSLKGCDIEHESLERQLWQATNHVERP